MLFVLGFCESALGYRFGYLLELGLFFAGGAALGIVGRVVEIGIFVL